MFNAKVYTVSIPSSGVALEEVHIAREVRKVDVDAPCPVLYRRKDDSKEIR